MGQNLALQAMQDQRRALSPELAHSPCGDSYVGVDQNERLVYGLSVCLEDGNTPSAMLGHALAKLMRDAGFTVLLADHALYPNDLVLRGRIERFFAINEPQSPGDQKPRQLVCSVDYELSFARKGKILATQRFRSDVSGYPYEQNLTLTYTWNSYLERAVNETLGKVAAYLQSPAFRSGVLGLGPSETGSF